MRLFQRRDIFGGVAASEPLRANSVAFDDAAFGAVGANGICGRKRNLVGATDVVKKAHPAYESHLMDMTIEGFAGDQSDWCIVRVVAPGRDDDYRSRVMAMISVRVAMVPAEMRTMRHHGNRWFPVSTDFVSRSAGFSHPAQDPWTGKNLGSTQYGEDHKSHQARRNFHWCPPFAADR